MLPALMQATSRESLGSLRSSLEQAARSQDAPTVAAVGEQLSEVSRVLSQEPGVRRALADPSASEQNRAELVRRLFGSRVSPASLDLLSAAAQSQWSSAGDLVDALTDLGQQAAFISAEKDGSFNTVEEEIFRFSRILDANGELEQRLSDQTAPVAARRQLLDRLIGGKLSPISTRLLESVLANPRVRSIANSVEGLVDDAAARRRSAVAIVKSPMALSAAQEQRLTASLSRIYGREMSVSVDVDPSVMGGLRVQVGEDVIDGSVAGQLDAIQRRFAG
ncbi:F0F1 ATP synthase subunit delta [Epidermidibacterium keratini]|uniref:ATP synthase subunit delta n=1 Tax=Epidermidibacterium keratini TaxID=1891644 RepID=A0A7L4YRW4_9ACTN|nr:F0F1 ATP synthase subunit delta [Epidermidibacterium keratini]QHC01703.1 F0F1 ATP synthase subunit delta [Epidermidibacterium keratini]